MALRNLVLIVLVMATGCTTVKKAATPAESRHKNTSSKKPVFIENIAIKPGKNEVPGEKNSIAGRDKGSFDFSKAGAADPSRIEVADAMMFKYAILMNMPVEDLGDTKLYSFIDDWYGTPYKYGGSTKNGIDCSAFTGFLLGTVYGVSIPRTSRQQFSSSIRISKKELSTGDLVFFKNRSTISHVGVYLGNNKFAHAATSGGVMISDLDEPYFARRYAGAGRFIFNTGINGDENAGASR